MKQSKEKTKGNKFLTWMHKNVLTIIAFTILCTPFSARAVNYFVSPDANEKNSGTKKNAPTSTRVALRKVKPGDSVIFMDGVYDTPLYLLRSGSADAPIILRADSGAVPVFRGTFSGKKSGLSTDVDISHYIIDGLWFEGWGESGIGLSWDHHVSGIEIRNCVADFNGRNGFAPYFASDVILKNNIASRNGWAPDSWSSNFDLYAVKGKNNLVQGNVSFHGVDTSSHRSDGNGFILDLSTDQGSARFENNIAFLNGGSCISITDSGGAQLIGNTCYANAQYGAHFLDELVLVNTCRPGIVGKVPLNGTPYTFSDLVVRDNLAAPVLPKKGFRIYSKCGGKKDYVDEHNLIKEIDPQIVLDDPSITNFRSSFDQRKFGLTFDYQCIHKETDTTKIKVPFWKFAPDLAYIKKIGGIAKCFPKSAG